MFDTPKNNKVDVQSIAESIPEVDECAPLLPKFKQKRTPLPKLQIAILLLLQFAEPVASEVIYPFINQLISELNITGGDKRKVGYYAGLIESLFFATEALTTLQWSRASDRIGRKPVILIGLSGVCLSLLSFGLSKTFYSLVISRCLAGLLNGNVGVMNSMLGELTDSTNMADGYGMLPIVWSMGYTLGPFIGGIFSKPHERFPRYFGNDFWKSYPYFLPCATSAGVILFSVIVTSLFLKETNTSLRKKSPQIDSEGETLASRSLSSSGASTPTLRANQSPEILVDAPLSLRKVLTPRVTISILNYSFLAFLNIMLIALQPLIYSTPTSYGGLGFTPATIGVWLGLIGFSGGVFQALFFAPIVRRVGTRNLFVACMSFFAVIFSVFPVIGFWTRRHGVTPFVWVLLSIQLCFIIVMEMAYGCVFMYITSSAPSKQSLGATNGLGQTMASSARAMGPMLATSLFALSVERTVMGGNAVYIVMVSLSLLALVPAMRLPEEPWDREGENLD